MRRQMIGIDTLDTSTKNSAGCRYVFAFFVPRSGPRTPSAGLATSTRIDSDFAPTASLNALLTRPQTFDAVFQCSSPACTLVSRCSTSRSTSSRTIDVMGSVPSTGQIHLRSRPRSSSTVVRPRFSRETHHRSAHTAKVSPTGTGATSTGSTDVFASSVMLAAISCARAFVVPGGRHRRGGKPLMRHRRPAGDGDGCHGLEDARTESARPGAPASASSPCVGWSPCWAAMWLRHPGAIRLSSGSARIAILFSRTCRRPRPRCCPGRGPSANSTAPRQSWRRGTVVGRLCRRAATFSTHGTVGAPHGSTAW